MAAIWSERAGRASGLRRLQHPVLPEKPRSARNPGRRADFAAGDRGIRNASRARPRLRRATDWRAAPLRMIADLRPTLCRLMAPKRILWNVRFRSASCAKADIAEARIG